jgi:hypothetical protein
MTPASRGLIQAAQKAPVAATGNEKLDQQAALASGIKE